MYDAIIIGGGPAGLNAALILGRCRRTVLLLDSGNPRNGASRALHGFLSRDGTSPHELRRLGREQLAAYPSVELRDELVIDAQRHETGFEVFTAAGVRERSRFLLLATGRADAVPDKPGFRDFYGRGVFHCPYCDGWENRDRPLVLYGKDHAAVDLALELLTWSDDLTVCTDGRPEWNAEDATALEQNQIRVRPEEITALEGNEGVLTRIRFATGETLKCTALFFCSDCLQRSSLPERLGCSFDCDGAVECDGHAATRVPGLYVAGNVRGGLHLAIAAAAEGAEAAVNLNDALLEAQLQTHRKLEHTVQ
jgi:thioredoxin reductase